MNDSLEEENKQAPVIEESMLPPEEETYVAKMNPGLTEDAEFDKALTKVEKYQEVLGVNQDMENTIQY